MSESKKKEKKCYIATFNAVNNYGTFWQAYALQKVCSEYMETYHLNIAENSKVNMKQLVKRYINPVRLMIDFVRRYKTKNLRKVRQEFFDEMRKKQLNLTRVYTVDTINDLPQDNARFIVGSDQMWNCHILNKASVLKLYLLDFVKDNKAKNSYAVSFGFYDVPLEYTDLYKECINSFNKISVRETKGAEIVSELTGRNAEVVLDPTLLLSKEEWDDIFKFKAYDEKYILIYSMYEKEYQSLLKTAQELSKKTGYKIYTIESGTWNYSLNTLNASPEEFLNRIYQAEYVVTNSFHGTVFSMNFNKKFFVHTLNKSGQNMNTRIDSLTKTFGLEDRVISGGNDLLAEIYYDRVNRVLDEKRSESVAFLESILNEE